MEELVRAEHLLARSHGVGGGGAEAETGTGRLWVVEMASVILRSVLRALSNNKHADDAAVVAHLAFNGSLLVREWSVKDVVSAGRS